MGNRREERYDRLQANDSHDAVIPSGQIPSAWAVASRVDLQEGFRFRMSMVGALRDRSRLSWRHCEAENDGAGSPPDHGPKGALGVGGLRPTNTCSSAQAMPDVRPLA